LYAQNIEYYWLWIWDILEVLVDLLIFSTLSCNLRLLTTVAYACCILGLPFGFTKGQISQIWHFMIGLLLALKFLVWHFGPFGTFGRVWPWTLKFGLKDDIQRFLRATACYSAYA